MSAHNNNFGFLRLLFATLVIVSHAPEIIDGNRHREPLVLLFGGSTFGDLAVFGFFLISGYLIVQSFQRSTTIRSYLLKRVRRIFPGYVVAYAVCVLVVAPLAGTNFAALGMKDYLLLLANGVGLQPPPIASFIGLPLDWLNASMWTISYEFRCYLLVIVFGAIGLYRNRWYLVALTAILLVLDGVRFDPEVTRTTMSLMGKPSDQIRFLAMFCAGSCFLLFGDHIRYAASMAAGAAAALLASMYFQFLPTAAFAVFGGYILFWAAIHLQSPIFARINSSDDISYGVYLYAWPISSLLVYFLGIADPVALFGLSLVLAYAAGFLSWKLVEKPFLRSTFAHSFLPSKPMVR